MPAPVALPVPARPSVEIFTFKTGLLSPIAHDLRLRCGEFRIEIDSGRVRATFDPRSLKVDGVMRRGTLDPAGLSASDYRKIEATVQGEILKTRAHPSIEFTGSLDGTSDGATVEGDLRLAGRTAAIPRARARRDRDAWILEVELQPSRWGVAPYRALAGALKLEDRVRVRLTLPVVEGLSAQAGTHTFGPG